MSGSIEGGDGSGKTQFVVLGHKISGRLSNDSHSFSDRRPKVDSAKQNRTENVEAELSFIRELRTLGSWVSTLNLIPSHH